MADEKLIYDVDLARDVKSFVVSNSDVTFTNATLKDKLFSIDDSILVRVGKIIGSLKVNSVDIVNKDFLKRVFWGNNSDNDEISK